MDAVKLEKLLVNEISGVDDPANMLPGWMVAKASRFKTALPIGPDRPWDVGAAEARVREKTSATVEPNPAYAATFLWFDGAADDENGDGVPDRFGDYKFLVVDVVEGKLMVMPQALRAAASRLPNSSLPDSDKESVRSALSKLEAKAGIGESATKRTDEGAQTIVGRIRQSILPARKEADMTADELQAALTERDDALVLKFAEAVAKAVTPVEGAPAGDGQTEEKLVPDASVKDEGTTSEEILAEDITKAIQAAFEPYHEILEKTLDRIERIEAALGVAARKSLDGQEGGPEEGVEKRVPTFGDAIRGLGVAAMRGERRALIGTG